MLRLIINWDGLNALDENEDISFVGGKELFNNLFDIILELNVLKGNGNKITSLLLDQFLKLDVPAEEFDGMDVDWPTEFEKLKNIVAAAFDILENSEIETYRELLEVTKNPQAHIDQLMLDENVRLLGTILDELSQSAIIETIANPLVNKFVGGALEGFPELPVEEYSGADAAEDIRTFVNILNDFADAELTDVVKALISEFTGVISEKQDLSAEIKPNTELYADIIEQLFSLNVLESESVKQYVLDKVDAMLGDKIDLSGIDVSEFDFEADGKIIADAYREFAEAFHQDLYQPLTVSDIVDIINGTTELTELVEMGINPYPYNFDKNASAQELQDKYAQIEAGTETEDYYSVAGRIMSMRNSGMFIDLQDDSGKIQIFSHKESVSIVTAEITTLDSGFFSNAIFNSCFLCFLFSPSRLELSCESR